MQFDELRGALKAVAFDSTRIDCDNLFEAVILRDEIGGLRERLQNFFGNPAWPSQNRLSFRIHEEVQGCGGIMPGQTLYYAEDGNDPVLAMLWPWTDGRHTTVRIIKKTRL